MDQSNRSYLLNRVLRRQLSSCNRLLHSVVNNSCGFHPQWKVVALIFSAARLPRLLEEICWQFAAGLPAFSSLPFFSNSDPNLSAKLASFSDPRQGPEKGSQIWAHLAMLFWLLVCARRACNSPNSYALPRGGCTGCGRDICLMDQSNRSNIFSTVFCDVNLAAATGCSTVL